MLKSFVSATAPFVPLVIAESTGFSGNELLVWLAILSFLAVLYNQLAEAWRNKTRGLKEKPRPADTYATIESCGLKHAAIEKDLRALAHENEEQKKQVRIDLKGIHERINKVAENNSELLGVIKAKLS